MCDPKLFPLISSVVTKMPELCNPLAFSDEVSSRQNEYRKVKSEIVALHEESKNPDACSTYRYVADDMLTNIIDGRFEEFLKSKPKIIDMTEAQMAQTRATHKTIIIANLETLKANAKPMPVDLGYSESLATVKKQSSEKTSREALEKCLQSMEVFKANFVAVRDVSQSKTRDLNFESKLQKIITNIADFKKVWVTHINLQFIYWYNLKEYIYI